MLFLKADKVPITKIWTFDAAKLPWDPEKLDNKNVGIPVSYRIVNDVESKLGQFALWGGKARLFQDDGHESTIVLGEDRSALVPVGEKMELYIGDSRDIVVTQRKMQDARIITHKNKRGNPVLYDTDEEIVANDLDPARVGIGLERQPLLPENVLQDPLDGNRLGKPVLPRCQRILLAQGDAFFPLGPYHVIVVLLDRRKQRKIV